MVENCLYRVTGVLLRGGEGGGGMGGETEEKRGEDCGGDARKKCGGQGRGNEGKYGKGRQCGGGGRGGNIKG